MQPVAAYLRIVTQLGLQKVRYKQGITRVTALV
jgi:hypothetical protein